MAHGQKELDNIETIKAWKEAYKQGPAEFIKYYTDDYVIWLLNLPRVCRRLHIS